jgi:hypothetical protein
MVPAAKIVTGISKDGYRQVWASTPRLAVWRGATKDTDFQY